MTHARCFSWVAGQSIEVFPSPFFQRVRDLANGCFSQYEHEHNGRELNWDTPNAETHAHRLLRSALSTAARGDDPPWLAEVTDIQSTLQRGKALELLYALAWDGGGKRPLGETYGWIDRMEQAQRETTA